MYVTFDLGSRPTPAEILDVIVDTCVPETSDLLPFTNPRTYAKRILSSGMLIHAFGTDHPLSQAVRAYTNYDRYPQSDPAFTARALEIIESAFKGLAEELQADLDSHKEAS